MNISEKLYESFGKLPSRRGRGGIYSYIKWKDVADRMNKTFGIDWSSEAVFQDIINDNVIIRVKVTVKNPESGEYVFQEGLGGASLNDGEPGDPFKAAYSKALKDACKKWGVALYKEESEKSTSVSTTPARPATPPAPPVSPTTPRQNITSPSVPSTPSAPTTPPSNHEVKETVVDAPTVLEVKAPPAPITPPATPAVTQPATPAPTPPLPPGVPEIVEQTIVVKQETSPEPTMETPSAPVEPKVPAAAVAPPMPATPKAAPTPVQEQPVAPTPPAQPLPSRPDNVPLSPTERVKRMKENKAAVKEEMPTVPPPNNNITTPPSNPGIHTESGINNVQKVAIEGLLDMKGLNYDEITLKALELTEGPPPELESLSYAEAIKVIRYVNDLYK